MFNSLKLSFKIPEIISIIIFILIEINAVLLFPFEKGWLLIILNQQTPNALNLSS